MARGSQGQGLDLLFSKRARSGLHHSVEEQAERVLGGHHSELAGLLERLERLGGERAERVERRLAEPLLKQTYADHGFEYIPDPGPETEVLGREALRELRRRCEDGVEDPFSGGVDPYRAWLARELGPLGQALIERRIFPPERASESAYRIIAGELSGERPSGALKDVIDALYEQYWESFAAQVRFRVELLEATGPAPQDEYFVAADEQQRERRRMDEWEHFCRAICRHSELEELDTVFRERTAAAFERRLRELAESGEFNPYPTHKPELSGRLSPEEAVEWARLYLGAEHQKAADLLERCAAQNKRGGRGRLGKQVARGWARVYVARVNKYHRSQAKAKLAKYRRPQA